ncbi:hypothetical protein GQ53DRAFT_740541, partial [Thozetella sp. PMI_491]
MDDFLDAVVGRDVRARLRQNAIARKNTPHLTQHMASRGGDRPQFGANRLWIVDRVLEPQTVPHFISSVGGGMSLPGGETPQPTLGSDDIPLFMQPYSSWAPAPFNTKSMPPVEEIMKFLGSHEDSSRLQVISKELHAMKSRLWEGIMPMSDRRWRERKLYDLDNFSIACHTISLAIDVFHYLNDKVIKAALRDTFNLIDGEWRYFANALNLKRGLEGKPALDISGLWLQFVRAQYAVMVNRTHAWIMGHVDLLKADIIRRLEAHGTPPQVPASGMDEEQWKLTNMWQDLTEISAQADYAILLPMDGYNGSGEDAGSSDYSYLIQPLSVKGDIKQRGREYHLRRKYFTMTKMILNLTENLTVLPPPRGAPMNDAGEIVARSREQDDAQRLARRELRGEPVSYEKEPWTLTVTKNAEWGFVAYRTHHGCTDAEWDEFRAKFEADAADWGQEIPGIDPLRDRSKIHWVDVKDLGIDGADIDALKGSFLSLGDSADVPFRYVSDIFLVADEASVSSYLNRKPESSPPGDAGGFILAVESSFDPEDGPSRPDESPGYEGHMRLLGSLLWDDLSVLVAAQTQHLEDLWPLAMNHPEQVYVGTVVEEQRIAWA